MELKSALRTKKALAAVTVTAVLAGGGAALAAGGDGPGREAEQFESDLANRLGVSETALEDAYEAAMIESVDRAREDGRITSDQAADAKEAIRSGELPPIGPPLAGAPGGPGGPSGHLPVADIASRYLGVSEEQLEKRLSAGESLAEVAGAEGKAVDGLRDAILADARERLSADVNAGRLDADDAQQMLAEMRSHMGDLLRGRLPEPPAGAPLGPSPAYAPGPPPLGGQEGGMVLPAPGPPPR